MTVTVAHPPPPRPASAALAPTSRRVSPGPTRHPGPAAAAPRRVDRRAPAAAQRRHGHGDRHCDRPSQPRDSDGGRGPVTSLSQWPPLPAAGGHDRRGRAGPARGPAALTGGASGTVAQAGTEAGPGRGESVTVPVAPTEGDPGWAARAATR